MRYVKTFGVTSIMRFTLIAFLLLVITDCKKKEDPKPNSTVPTVSLVNASGTPGDIVVADANFKPNISPEGTFITVGGVQVKAFLSENNQVVFIMPVLPSGKATIDYTNIGGSSNSEITIDTYIAIAEPNKILDSFATQVDLVISQMHGYEQAPQIQLDPQYADVLNYMKQTMASEFGKLTPEEQIQLAYILKNNIPDPNDFKLDTLSSDAYMRVASINYSERLVEVGQKFKGDVIKCITFSAIGAGLALLPSPLLVDKLAAVASLTTGLIYLSKARGDIEEIGRLIGLFGSDLASEISQSGNNLRLSASSGIPFKNNETKAFAFTGKFRNIIQSDSTSSVFFIGGIFSSQKKYDVICAKIRSSVDKLKSWFSGSSSLPTNTNPLRTVFNSKYLPIDASNIILKNVSNSKIHVTYVPQGSTIKITVSTTLEVDTEFSFDVVYTDPVTNKSVTKTYDCVFQNPPLELGQTYAGGLIFYLDATKRHGLVAAPKDQIVGQSWDSPGSWGCFNHVIPGASNPAVGFGKWNTSDIMKNCSDPNGAAYICSNLVLNGYDDWFLPSKGELDLMYENLHLKGLGNFTADEVNLVGVYWSSTQYSGSEDLNAWGRYFVTGVSKDYAKGTAYCVRAVREF